MSTAQIRDLPSATSLDGSELVELQKAAGGVGSSEQTPNGALLPPGYIEGLKMQWVSGNAITVSSGSAYIPSLGRVVRASAAMALSGLALATSTWYHVYLYLNAGTPTLECVTTAPAAAYFGTARTKTGDTSRRYVGSVNTDASGNVIAFYHDSNSNEVGYLADIGTPMLSLLSGGASLTPTNVSCSNAMPITARFITLFVENTASGGCGIGNSQTTTSGANLFYVRGIDQPVIAKVLADSNQAIQYHYFSAISSGGLSIYSNGYTYER